MDWLDFFYKEDWPRPSKTNVVVFAVCVGAFWLYALSDKDGYLGLIDGFNLLMHEAGHVFFTPFGHTMHFLGGTLFQLIVPVIFCVSFWRSNQPAGFAVAGILFGQNFLNIARYVSDAIDMELPLVGGGEHDWNVLLGGTSLLRHSPALGKMLYFFGWVVMICFAAWYVMLYFRGATVPGGEECSK